jgi:hypothetical protein
MVGWQARAVYDADWKTAHLPKYYTAPGTPRRLVLYNLGNAMHYRTGIVVEGVTDVWKTGPQAVCTLGATMTRQQQSLFASAFQDYAGILLYDPDIQLPKQQQIQELVRTLNSRLKSGFCSVVLPAGTDPGSLTRDFLRQYISQEAAKQNVHVDWRKRKCET